MSTAVIDPKFNFNISISCDLFRNILESLSCIAVSTHLYLDPKKGLKGVVLDQPERFLAEFFIHRHCFEMDEYLDELEDVVDIPLYFEGIIEFITYLPKGYVLKFWPRLRCLQGMNLDECKSTDPFTYSEQEHVVYLPSYTNRLFPPVNLERFSYSIVMSKNEFSHQIELALVNSEHVHVAICNRFILFYAEGNGKDQKVIPATRLTADHPLIPQGFNELDDESVSKPSNKTNPYAKVSQLVELDGITDPCLIQQHSLRHLSFVCKARHSSDYVIVGMSPEYGLVVNFPVRGYGLSKLNNKNVLQEESFFRYRLLPNVNSTRPLLPIPELSHKVLKMKIANDLLVEQRKQQSQAN